LAEKEYYHDLFEANKGNLKNSWDIIKGIINKKQSSRNSSEFIINGQKTSDKEHIANAFNGYFTNVGKSLNDKLPPSNVSPLHYLDNINVNNSLYLYPTDENEVLRIVSNIKTNSVGWDNIHIKVIKTTFQPLNRIFVHLINKSLSSGVFPDEMKVARVIPLFKGGDSQLINNYRPVSVLSIFSKIYERIIYNRVLKFINDNDLLYKYQFGFRANYSTSMALITLTDKIITAIDKNDITLGTFLDFSKAFDTIDHSILLRKLYKYGIRGVANDLVKSYLKKRKQYVSFDKISSESLPINCGVPQGSILGPLFFILYVNDIYLVSNSFMPILFADDSSVFVQGKNINSMTTNLNNSLDLIYQWTIVNRLSLNIDKTY
jgi:hypothetical protein